MWKQWFHGTGQSVLASVLVALVPGVFVTYLMRIQSGWSGPVLGGMGAWALAMVIVLSLDAVRRLPAKRLIPSLKNIESCVRDWLNNFNCGVMKSPSDTAIFRYVVTIDSGIRLVVGRPKEGQSEYLLIRANMGANDDDIARYNKLKPIEKSVLLGQVRLELARRKMGYRNLVVPWQDFYIQKRIPIRETLTEYEFMTALDEVEAAYNGVTLVFALELAKGGQIEFEDEKLFDNT